MWRAVVENLLYFMHELIPGAYSCGNWTKEGVDRAISWTLYCEKLMKRPSQQGALQDIINDLHTKYNWIISYHQLQNAQVYLFRFLIQNQLIDKNTKDYILGKACEFLGTSIVEEIEIEARQQIKHHRQLFGLFFETDKIYMEIQMRLLLDTANTFSIEQLSSHLKRAVSQPCGLKLLVSAVISENCCRGGFKSSLLALNWLEDVLQSQNTSLYATVVSQLIDLPPNVLCSLLKHRQSLLSIVLSVMKSEGMELRPHCIDGNVSWIHTEGKSVLNYSDIIKLYLSLQTDPDIGHHTKEILMQWLLENESMLWKDILKLN